MSWPLIRELATLLDAGAVDDSRPPLDVLLELLSSDPARSHSRSFSHERDTAFEPYELIARGRGGGFPLLASAIGVTGLHRLSSPALTGASIYIDPMADPTGHHRGYLRDEESLPGCAWMYLGSLEQTLSWMLTIMRTGKTAVSGVELDDWEKGPGSGSFVLEAILDEDLVSLWDGGLEARVGREAPPELDVDDKEPGWGRRRCLFALRYVAAVGNVPRLDSQGLNALQISFIDHLQNLCENRAVRASRNDDCD